MKESNSTAQAKTAKLKGFSAILNIVLTTAVVIVVLLAVFLVGIRFLGLSPYCVLSGSMEPQYRVGSLIYVKSVEPGEVNEGDAITFVLNEQLTVATHRVVAIDAENERFYTKGDANQIADTDPVLFKNLIGKPVFSIPYLGFVSNFFSSALGKIVGICGGVLLLTGAVLLEVLKKRG